MQAVCAALQIPSDCVIDGEEGILILLRRLAYPNRLIYLAQFFHRAPSALSEIFIESCACCY